ncbi:MAG: zinc ABC transporter substrate-binding protein [Clostridia bacterium]|nr:zinc ABC transporter substrate-binding protein [Clostridia bacterium]
MKKKGMLCALLACLMLSGGCALADAEKTFVTSFYPMYVFTLNVTRDVPGVRVVNMADQSVGCLHDYQLQTRDMVAIEGADALVINGGGMEAFMDKVAAQRPDLPVIEAAEGIEMLCSAAEGHDHGAHDHHDHGGEALNAHVWLDPDLAARQVNAIAQGLAAADAENAAAYIANAQAYTSRLEQLKAEIGALLAPHQGKGIVTFHEAFTYFAGAFGIEIAGVIAHDPGEEPGTREIARTCDLVKELGIGALFVEPQYPTKTADTIARETGAAVYMLDPVVSGDGGMDSYETIMMKNAQVLSEALSR